MFIMITCDIVMNLTLIKVYQKLFLFLVFSQLRSREVDVSHLNVAGGLDLNYCVLDFYKVNLWVTFIELLCELLGPFVQKINCWTKVIYWICIVQSVQVSRWINIYPADKVLKTWVLVSYIRMFVLWWRLSMSWNKKWFLSNIVLCQIVSKYNQIFIVWLYQYKVFNNTL